MCRVIFVTHHQVFVLEEETNAAATPRGARSTRGAGRSTGGGMRQAKTIPFRRRSSRGVSIGGKEPEWPWLGLAACALTGDIAVADTQMDTVVLL